MWEIRQNIWFTENLSRVTCMVEKYFYTFEWNAHFEKKLKPFQLRFTT